MYANLLHEVVKSPRHSFIDSVRNHRDDELQGQGEHLWRTVGCLGLRQDLVCVAVTDYATIASR